MTSEDKICIELENIELSYLDKTVLTTSRLAIHQFDRIGIVGKNGAGKSSLLKLIAGHVEPNKGNVKRFIDVAYFDQVTLNEDTEANYTMLSKLAVPKIATNHFSGGEQTRLKLAQLFSSYYEGMLIDEPTTHLDEAGKQFLLEELMYYYGALVLVSHDRYVLDQLVTKIWEIEDGHVREFTGNYTDYVAQKELEKEQQEEKHEKYVKEKTRLAQAAEEKMQKAKKVTQASKRVSKKDVKAKANKMFMTKSKDTSQKNIEKAAKALEQRMEQLEVVEAPKEETKIRFRQPTTLQLHNKFPIMAKELSLTVGDKQLLKDADFQFPLGRTIALTGANGSGKTTLLHHIMKHGEGLTLSPKAVFGMYEQMEYQFKNDETVLHYMKERSDYDEGQIRTVLHTMDFTGTDLQKNVRHLSGGEAIRLVLCQLFLGQYNILMLDEPTNFLDIQSIEALERLITAYNGTVLLVSHDKTFLDRVADDNYVIEGQKVKRVN